MNVSNKDKTVLEMETPKEIAERVLSPRLNKLSEEEKRALIVSIIVRILGQKESK